MCAWLAWKKRLSRVAAARRLRRRRPLAVAAAIGAAGGVGGAAAERLGEARVADAAEADADGSAAERASQSDNDAVIVMMNGALEQVMQYGTRHPPAARRHGRK